MPYLCEWSVLGNLWLIAYGGKVSVPDMTEAGSATLAMLDDAAGIVNILCDLSEVDALPALPQMTQNERSRRYYQHRNMGWTIYICGENRAAQSFVVSILVQHYGGRARTVTTMEEALAFLEQIS